MSAFAKAFSLLVLLAGAAGQVVATDMPRFEFIGVQRGAPEKSVLVFGVKATSQGVSEDLHTVYCAHATVIESSVKGLKKGMVFEAVFDRWFSIFEAPSEHPLKIGDQVEVGVTDVADHTISGFLKAKRSANQMPEPTSGSVTPRADARVAPPPPVAHR